MRRKLKALLAASALAIATVTPSQAFIFGGIVYDPTNHTQNLLTAARTLQMINNQIRQLANEAQVIVNQAENLKICRSPLPLICKQHSRKSMHLSLAPKASRLR